MAQPVAPQPPNAGAAALAAATERSATPVGVPEPGDGPGRHYLILPPDNRRPGDMKHSVDHNMIVDAIKALEWAYFVIRRGEKGDRGDMGWSAFYQPDAPATNEDLSPLEQGEVWIDSDGSLIIGLYVGKSPPGRPLAEQPWFDTNLMTLKVWDAVNHEWMVSSRIGIPGPEGPRGSRGPQGAGFVFKGPVGTETDLPSVAEVGEAHITLDDGHLHMWDGTQWVDGGSIAGPPGPAGAASTVPGPVGPDGPPGPAGPTGADSTVPGPAGPIGLVGPAGPQGAASTVPGPAGPVGPVGGVGPAGPQGVIGPASTVPGPQGVVGPQGLKGDKGDKGDQGIQGVQGSTGLTGTTGPAGPAGATGATGADSTVAGPQGVKGDTGDKGDQGTGITIGATVATVADLPATGAAPNEVHFVSDSGNLRVWVGAGAPGADPTTPGGGWQNLGHVQGPQGVKGDTGTTGPAGPKGDTGLQGPQGAAGTNGADGAAGAKGDKGDVGPSPLPVPTAADAGKMPIVQPDGTVAWTADNTAPTWADVKTGAI